MFRLNVILVAILVACSLSLVTVSHRARQLFVELENEQAAAKQGPAKGAEANLLPEPLGVEEEIAGDEQAGGQQHEGGESAE